MMDAIILPRLRFLRARGQQIPPAAREEGRSDAETGPDALPLEAQAPVTLGLPVPRGPRLQGRLSHRQGPGSSGGEVPRALVPGSPRPLRAAGAPGAQERPGTGTVSTGTCRFPPGPPPPAYLRVQRGHRHERRSLGSSRPRRGDGATRGAGPAALRPREVAVRGAAAAALGRPAGEVSCGSTHCPRAAARGGRRGLVPPARLLAAIGRGGGGAARDPPPGARPRRSGSTRGAERPSENEAEREALSRPQETGVSEPVPAPVSAPFSRCGFTVKSRRV